MVEQLRGGRERDGDRPLAFVGALVLPPGERASLPLVDEFIALDDGPVCDISEVMKRIASPTRTAPRAPSIVVLRLLVDASGRVVRYLCRESSGDGRLDRAVAEAVAGVRWTPGHSNGVPVSCWTDWPLRVELR